MANPVHQAVQVTSVGNSISFNAAYPAGVQPGDLLLMLIGGFIAYSEVYGTLTVPNGWTACGPPIGASGASNRAVKVWAYWRVAAGENQAALALEGGSATTDWIVSICRITGANVINPVDAYQTTPDNQGANHAQAVANGVTPNLGEDLLYFCVCALQASSTGQTWTPPNGMTEVVDQGRTDTPPPIQEVCWQNLNGTAPTGTRSATISNVFQTAAMWMIAIGAPAGEFWQYPRGRRVRRLSGPVKMN
jgi:hypothetical protein